MAAASRASAAEPVIRRMGGVVRRRSEVEIMGKVVERAVIVSVGTTERYVQPPTPLPRVRISFRPRVFSGLYVAGSDDVSLRPSPELLAHTPDELATVVRRNPLSARTVRKTSATSRLYRSLLR